MPELTLNDLIKRFNIISKSLAVDKYDYPNLQIKMRMNWDEQESIFYASFDYMDVKEGSILESIYGNGNTPEEAMRDYYKQIVGNTLVFHAMDKERRRECVVVG